MVIYYIYEGINLIYNNKNTITKYIHNKVIKNDFRVLAKSTNSEGYELIFEIKNTHKKKFKITFITQMKGVSHNYNYNNPNKNPINKIIKLNP